MSNMKTTIQLRRGTAQEWKDANPTPAIGEPCFETDTGILKIGDGETSYNNLPSVNTDGIYDADNVIFDSDLVITADVGVHTIPEGEGSIILETTGKSVRDVFSMILANEENPAITQPSVSVACSQMKAYEVGTKVTPSYTVTFNTGKYEFDSSTGVTATSYSVKDANNVTKTTATGSFAELQVKDDTRYSITATVNHSAGNIPKTNLGNNYSAGKITAGSKSGTKGTITGYRSFFYGVSDNTNTVTSAIVRGLAKNGGAYNDSKTFTITTADTTKRIIVAIPKASITGSRTGLKTVLLETSMNADITSEYKKQSQPVSVQGVNGYTGADYDVYIFEPDLMTAGQIHKITLG